MEGVAEITKTIMIYIKIISSPIRKSLQTVFKLSEKDELKDIRRGKYYRIRECVAHKMVDRFREKSLKYVWTYVDRMKREMFAG